MQICKLRNNRIHEKAISLVYANGKTSPVTREL